MYSHSTFDLYCAFLVLPKTPCSNENKMLMAQKFASPTLDDSANKLDN